VVEAAVVGEDAFLEVELGDGCVGGVEDVSAVVGSLFSQCKWQFSAWVNAAVEDVCDGVARLLACKLFSHNTKKVCGRWTHQGDPPRG
jgi:hypothetical protein